jgi:hypothetical protein
LLFAVPEGEIKLQAVVRVSKPGKGMGVEFISVGAREFDTILKVVKRLMNVKNA